MVLPDILDIKVFSESTGAHEHITPRVDGKFTPQSAQLAQLAQLIKSQLHLKCAIARTVTISALSNAIASGAGNSIALPTQIGGSR